ncbi:MAG: CoA pyrophosphatase [Flavobacteriales bacterium]|nr:CoA pyrophosphatase [Flavobacteriales bacterium]
MRSALNEPLPGHDRFLELSGYERPEIEAALRQDPAPRESAVLVLLYPEKEALHTLLMVRQEYDGVHSGQVSFPGGRREEQDVDLQATALREFTEETGVNTVGIEVIGALSRVYIPPSRSLVTPFVAYCDALGPTHPDPHEVKALLEVPFSDVLRDNVVQHREHYIQVLGRKATIPYFDLAGHVVWGATAMMLAELRELVMRHG